MAKYHINDEGNAGECSAKTGNCPFGGDDEHYTSAEAARAAFEANFSDFPSMRRKTVDVESLYSRALTKAPLEKVTEKIIANAPPGTIFMKIHHESNDRAYLMKTSSGTIERFYQEKGTRQKKLGLPIKPKDMLLSGSSSYYIAGSPFESDYTKEQASAGFQEPAYAQETAKLYYDEYRKRQGIIGPKFEEISQQEQNAWTLIAKKALSEIYFRGPDSSKEQMAKKLQQEWVNYLPGADAQPIDNRLLLETAARVLAERPLA